jgi:hypothetical protein
MGFATFWAIFSPTHLVTLPTSARYNEIPKEQTKKSRTLTNVSCHEHARHAQLLFETLVRLLFDFLFDFLFETLVDFF